MTTEISRPEPPSSPPVPMPGRMHGVVGLIVLLGLALRLLGIGWSLPDARHPFATYHPDELINLNAAVSADISHGKFDIGFYSYGAFYFYMVSLAQTVGRGYHLIPAANVVQTKPLSDVEQMRLGAAEQSALFLTGRLVTALLGTATLPVVFFLGSRLYGRRTGLLAALLYAIAPLAVVHAHFLTVDVPATFFVSLALLLSVRLHGAPTWKNVIIAGVWCGLAAATKYTAAVVIVAPLAALALQIRRSGSPGIEPGAVSAAQRAGALALVAALVFLVACPGPWLNWNAFWNGTYVDSGLRYELFEHTRRGHGNLFKNTGFGWWYHLNVSLRYGLGLPLLVLSLAGVAYAMKRREPGDLLLLTFLLIAYAISSLSEVRFARYLIPLYPAFCVLAARVVVAPWLRPAWQRTALGMGAVVVLWTALYSVSLVRAMTVQDPRDRAADYLRQNARPGATAAFAHTPWFYSPPLSPLWGAPAYQVRVRAVDESGQLQFRMPAHDWDLGVLVPPPDYVILSNFELQHEWRRLRMRSAAVFMQALESGYSATIFAPSPVLGLSPDDMNAPQDLLYILPTVVLYAPGPFSRQH